MDTFLCLGGFVVFCLFFAVVGSRPFSNARHNRKVYKHRHVSRPMGDYVPLSNIQNDTLYAPELTVVYGYKDMKQDNKGIWHSLRGDAWIGGKLIADYPPTPSNKHGIYLAKHPSFFKRAFGIQKYIRGTGAIVEQEKIYRVEKGEIIE